MACKCVLALIGAYFLAFVSPAVGSCSFNSDCTSYGATAAEANVRISLVRTRPVVLPAQTVPAPSIVVPLVIADTTWVTVRSLRHPLEELQGTYSSGWYHSVMRCLLCPYCLSAASLTPTGSSCCYIYTATLSELAEYTRTNCDLSTGCSKCCASGLSILSSGWSTTLSSSNRIPDSSHTNPILR